MCAALSCLPCVYPCVSGLAWRLFLVCKVERLSKISRSPIFADFSQTLAGAPAIRAYGCAGRFVARAERAMDANNACVVVVQLCFSWLSIRLDAIGTQK